MSTANFEWFRKNDEHGIADKRRALAAASATKQQISEIPEPPRPQAAVVKPTSENLWAVLEFDVFGATRIHGFKNEGDAATALQTLPTKFSAQTTKLLSIAINPPRQGQGFLIPMLSLKVAMGDYFAFCAEHPQSLTKLQSDQIALVENLARQAVTKYQAETAHITADLEDVCQTGRFFQPPGKNYVIDAQTKKIVMATGLAAENPGIEDIEALCLYPDLAVLLALKSTYPQTVQMARVLAAHLFGDVQIPDTAGVCMLEPGAPFKLLAWGGRECLITQADLITL
jgi:hypothetical protein